MMNVPQSVWVVDDDPINRFLYDKLLAAKFSIHAVQFFINGHDARVELLRLIESGTFPDMIFLDKDMPVMNGWDFLDWYQTLATDLRGTTKIIMATSVISEEDRLKTQQYSCLDGCVLKPVTLDMLSNAIAAVSRYTVMYEENADR